MKNLKESLSGKLPDDVINEIIIIFKPMDDFYEYMLVNYNMDYDDVETESSKYSIEIFNEYLQQMINVENKIKFVMEISGDIMKKYADKYNYPFSDDIKRSMVKYNEILLKYNINER